MARLNNSNFSQLNGEQQSRHLIDRNIVSMVGRPLSRNIYNWVKVYFPYFFYNEYRSKVPTKKNLPVWNKNKMCFDHFKVLKNHIIMVIIIWSKCWKSLIFLERFALININWGKPWLRRTNERMNEWFFVMFCFVLQNFDKVRHLQGLCSFINARLSETSNLVSFPNSTKNARWSHPHHFFEHQISCSCFCGFFGWLMHLCSQWLWEQRGKKQLSHQKKVPNKSNENCEQHKTNERTFFVSTFFFGQI